MKTLFLFFSLVALAIVAAASEDASLNGTWQIRRNAGGNESKQDCTFSQKENVLTGTCTNDQGSVQINGKVAGKSATWTYKGDSQGGPVTVVYTGTIDSATKITGTVLAVEFSVEGEFTATRSK